jgi:MFS family permease
MLTSAGGVGAVTAGIYLTQHLRTAKLFQLALLSSTCAAVILILLALNSSFPLALAMLFLLGFTMAICSTSTQIFIQLSVRDNMRGRVLSLWAAIIRGGPAVGAPILGWLSGFDGFRWPLLVGGSLCLLVLIAVYRQYRRISSLPGPSIENAM